MQKPIIGKKCFLKYRGAIRECEIIGGAATLRHRTFKRVLAVKVAGAGIRRFGDAEIPDFYLTEQDARTGKTTPVFKGVSFHAVLKEALKGDYTYSTDCPWCVTRYKWHNGNICAKSFRLPRAVRFTKSGAGFFEPLDFGDYNYATMTQCAEDNRVVRFEEKPHAKRTTITFTSEDVLI